jgi:hypothetical protein
MQAASDGACFLVSSRAVQVWPLWACGCWDAYGAAPSSRIPLQTGQASGHTKVLTGQLLASCPSDLMVSGSSLSLWFLVPCACRYPSPEGPAIALYPAATHLVIRFCITTGLHPAIVVFNPVVSSLSFQGIVFDIVPLPYRISFRSFLLAFTYYLR